MRLNDWFILKYPKLYIVFLITILIGFSLPYLHRMSNNNFDRFFPILCYYLVFDDPPYLSGATLPQDLMNGRTLPTSN